MSWLTSNKKQKLNYASNQKSEIVKTAKTFYKYNKIKGNYYSDLVLKVLNFLQVIVSENEKYLHKKCKLCIKYDDIFKNL